jgi:hypothetical protein
MLVHFKMRLKSWNCEKKDIREDNTETETGKGEEEKYYITELWINL